MEGISVRDYKLKLGTNGRESATRLMEYPDDAMAQFWSSAHKLIDRTERGEYGVDMELAAPSKQSVTLELDGRRIIEIAVLIR